MYEGFMKEKLIKMLTLQNEMNTKVHPHWRAQGFRWDRAIWTECAELLDHHGWKWWKHQEPDWPQIILEIVDIWHFGLSDVMSRADSVDNIAKQIEHAVLSAKKPDNFLTAVEKLAGYVLEHQTFSVGIFAEMMLVANLSMDELYRKYVGKNVLNFFRQDHGYKDGTYIKKWDGREDNEHLVEIVEQLDCDSASFSEDVYSALKVRYATQKTN
jgi:dimeric dUTPase (all-alpha-NTP-PPase superfamily)